MRKFFSFETFEDILVFHILILAFTGFPILVGYLL